MIDGREHEAEPDWCEWCSRFKGAAVICDRSCRSLSEAQISAILGEAYNEERYNDPLWNDVHR